ncbi:MAG: LysM peptidoglycan-binding domain-containing protein [Acidimicrobiia bacterium]
MNGVVRNSTRLVRGLLAAAVLVGLVVVVPVLLVRFVGWPLPTSVPAPRSVVEEIERRGISDVTLAKVIALVVWMAWARFSLSLVVEVIAAVRHRPAPVHRSLGGSQRLAAGLVAAIIAVVGTLGGMSGAGAARMPALRSVSPSSLRFEATRSSPTMPAATTVPSDAGTEDRWLVARNDSLWGIAEQVLGDGTRWREIVDGNVGREVSPGVVFDHATETIQPGWELLVPPRGTVDLAGTARAVIRVEEGDTLASLAADVYGDAAEWSTLWEANAGREFDQRSFDDPDLIVPGWELIVPDDPRLGGHGAVDPLVRSADDVGPSRADLAGAATTPAASCPTIAPVAAAAETQGVPAGAVPGLPADVAAPAAATPGPAAPAAAPTVAPPPAVDLAPATAPPVAPAAVAPVTVAPETVEPVTVDPSTDRAASSMLPAGVLGLGTATLLGTGVVGVVTSLRRRRLRAAGRDVRVLQTSEPSSELELTLRAVSADERLARVGLVVRATHAHLVATSQAARLVAVVAHDDGRVDVHLDGVGPLAPQRFSTTGPSTWSLPGSVPIGDIAAGPRFAAFPSPALAQIGRQAAADVFVDLESCGLLTISADDRWAPICCAG